MAALPRRMVAFELLIAISILNGEGFVLLRVKVFVANTFIAHLYYFKILRVHKIGRVLFYRVIIFSYFSVNVYPKLEYCLFSIILIPTYIIS